jgi:hypothetical protein
MHFANIPPRPMLDRRFRVIPHKRSRFAIFTKKNWRVSDDHADKSQRNDRWAVCSSAELLVGPQADLVVTA